MKKIRVTGGGAPPTPPKYDPLLEAVAVLIKDELSCAELQYDSSCREVPESLAGPSSREASPLLVLEEGEFGKNYKFECNNSNQWLKLFFVGWIFPKPTLSKVSSPLYLLFI